MSVARPFDALADEIHAWARSKGFYEREWIEVADDEVRYAPARRVPNPSLSAEKVALLHEEASEVLGALRDGDPDKEAEELADLVIRCLDYASWRGISLDEQVARKMGINRGRPRLHGRRF